MSPRRCIAWCLVPALLLAAGLVAAKSPTKKSHSKHAAVAAPAPSTAPVPTVVDPSIVTLETVSGMASAGAPRIALQVMDQHQPDFTQDAVGWMSWERERIYIYQSNHDWHAVIERADKLPAGVSPDFHAWEEMQAADAWLHVGEGGKARALVQPIIWDTQSPPDDRELAALRQLLIRSYIADQKLDDAQTAVIRYRQDYPKDAGNWPVLEARLFLRLGQPQESLDVLQDVRGPEAQMLALLASLRTGDLEPADVLAQAVKIGGDEKAPVDERVHAWVIAAEAADQLKDSVSRIDALQKGLALEPVLLDQDDIFTLNADMLWDAYVTYGQDLGNDLQLVQGDDQAWFVAASNRFDTAPIGACALFSLVAYHAGDPQQVDVAHWQFATLIQKQKDGDVLLRHLYLDSSRFKGVDTIPANVRYLLVDDVLELPDIPLASRLMQGLDAPPPGTTASAWQLERARVLILGGDPEAGVASLNELLTAQAAAPTSAPAATTAAPAAPAPAPKPVDVDEVLQVLFDLQTLHRDKDAIPLFEILLSRPLVPEQRRQMLYWTADSYKALSDYPKAAELYLRSAMLPDPFSMDQWAQTSRYQAAQMLAKAGYIDDARNLYKGLLSATRDPSQQAVLEHDLQQLMLMPTKPVADKQP